MKYLFTIMALLFACSNPADVQPDLTEYSISYEGTIHGGGGTSYRTFYNPETGESVSGSGSGTGFSTTPMTAHSGQTLWITVTSEQDVTAYIRVDGEIVAESATGDSVYVEWRLL